jgi:hypothetical protein
VTLWLQVVLESARAVSNVSRTGDSARELLLREGLHRRCVALVDHHSSEVAYTACGVLLNVAASSAGRAALNDAVAAPTLVAALQRLWHRARDAAACTLLCRTLCNAAAADDRGAGGGGGGGLLLSADECVTVLGTLGDIVDDMQDVLDAGGDADGGVDCGGAAELLEAARRLRAAVQSMVHDGDFREEDDGAAAAGASARHSDWEAL